MANDPVLWWLTFATNAKGHLGVCFVYAPTFLEAIAESRRLKIYPGEDDEHIDTRGHELHPDKVPPERWTTYQSNANKLLTRTDLIQLELIPPTGSPA